MRRFQSDRPIESKDLVWAIDCPNTRHEEIMALGRVETAERRREIYRWSDVIANLFRSRTELKLKNEDKNFECKRFVKLFSSVSGSSVAMCRSKLEKRRWV